MKSGKLLTGVILGGTVGVILGLLFAPAKGSESRDKLAQKGLDLKANLKNKINDLTKKVSNETESIKEDLTTTFPEQQAEYEDRSVGVNTF